MRRRGGGRRSAAALAVAVGSGAAVAVAVGSRPARPWPSAVAVAGRRRSLRARRRVVRQPRLPARAVVAIRARDPHTSARHVPQAPTPAARCGAGLRPPAAPAAGPARRSRTPLAARIRAARPRAGAFRCPRLTTVNVIASRDALTRSIATSARASARTTSAPASSAGRHGRKYRGGLKRGAFPAPHLMPRKADYETRSTKRSVTCPQTMMSPSASGASLTRLPLTCRRSAAVVEDHGLLAAPRDQRVAAGDRSVVEHDVRRGTAADVHQLADERQQHDPHRPRSPGSARSEAGHRQQRAFAFPLGDPRQRAGLLGRRFDVRRRFGDGHGQTSGTCVVSALLSGCSSSTSSAR